VNNKGSTIYERARVGQAVNRLRDWLADVVGVVRRILLPLEDP
jgi:hypothetical protein